MTPSVSPSPPSHMNTHSNDVSRCSLSPQRRTSLPSLTSSSIPQFRRNLNVKASPLSLSLSSPDLVIFIEGSEFVTKSCIYLKCIEWNQVVMTKLRAALGKFGNFWLILRIIGLCCWEAITLSTQNSPNLVRRLRTLSMTMKHRLLKENYKPLIKSTKSALRRRSPLAPFPPQFYKLGWTPAERERGGFQKNGAERKIEREREREMIKNIVRCEFWNCLKRRRGEK